MRANQRRKNKSRRAPTGTAKPGEPWDAQWLELGGESERGAAIVGAVLLEEMLGQEILKALVDDPLSVRALGSARGADAKAALAFALGLITRNELHNIELIAEIRNKFAHRMHGATFRDRAISQLCMNLKVIEASMTREQVKDPRARFNWVIGRLGLRFSQSQHLPRKDRPVELKPMTNDEIKVILDSIRRDK